MDELENQHQPRKSLSLLTSGHHGDPPVDHVLSSVLNQYFFSKKEIYLGVYPWDPGEGVRYPGTEVTGGLEQSNVASRNRI